MFTLPTAPGWIATNSLFLFLAVLFPDVRFCCQTYFCNKRCSFYVPAPQYTAPFQQNVNTVCLLIHEQLYLFADSHVQYFHVPLIPSGANAYLLICVSFLHSICTRLVFIMLFHCKFIHFRFSCFFRNASLFQSLLHKILCL